MTSWAVRVPLLAACSLALPFRAPARLAYQRGEGGVYELSGADPIVSHGLTLFWMTNGLVYACALNLVFYRERLKDLLRLPDAGLAPAASAPPLLSQSAVVKPI